MEKNWTNENYPAIGNTLLINDQDTVVVGNFCGDEAQEVFVIKLFPQTAALYQFHTNHWEKIWNGNIPFSSIKSMNKEISIYYA